MINHIKYVVLATVLCIASFFVFNIIEQNNVTRSNKSIISEKKRLKATNYDRPNAFVEHFRLLKTKVGETDTYYPQGNLLSEFNLAKELSGASKKSKLAWRELGPGNVGGRTRTVLLDPDDPQHTWIAGAVTGGIWKTTNAGQTWVDIAPDLPNLAITSLASSRMNKNIIYAGTGEGVFIPYAVRGDGIFKSIDGGKTWNLLASTSGNANFHFVNKIIVNPTEARHLIVATNTGVFLSLDGGVSWKTAKTSGSAIRDIEADPTNFSTLFFTADGLGAFKSLNGGSSWKQVFTIDALHSRSDLSISPSDPNKMFILAATNTSEPNDAYYFSEDKGENWYPIIEQNGARKDFAAEQGWYDLATAVNPYNPKELYAAGIYLGKMEVVGEPVINVLVSKVLSDANFISFINFGGDSWSGKLGSGVARNYEGITAADLVNVQIKFGVGISQKAHRFVVPSNSGVDKDGGAGVAEEDYTYQDYVTVPFQVWDIKNNRQLMVSFRDNERDGVFNLLEQSANNSNLAREYLYVHAIDYSLSPNAKVAKAGGQIYKAMYFIWPTLAKGNTWNANALPTATVTVELSDSIVYQGKATLLSDSRTEEINANLHPDHHFLQLVKTDEATQNFMIVNGNDGGLGLSKDRGETWQQITNGYNTTQFYGADKVIGQHKYFGGMQDNGTWLSPENPTQSSKYTFEIGGDGFEVACHATNPKLMIGGAYNNYFQRSTDGGTTWQDVEGDLVGEGPFFSRLSYSDAAPDVLFAVANQGVFKSANFGRTWTNIPMKGDWPQSVFSEVARVSLADPKVVWAGGGFVNGETNIYLSKNQGAGFVELPKYVPMEGYHITDIATHPIDSKIAYLLYAAYGLPKVLRTTDSGTTWTDITKFNKVTERSENGFPNVAVYSLFVMPHNPDQIWVGTEIGIVESVDNGATWHLANNGLPAVSVWQMKSRDNELICATHGRGIWALDITPVDARPQVTATHLQLLNATALVTLQKDYNKVELYLNGELINALLNQKAGQLSIPFVAKRSGTQKMSVTAFLNDAVETSSDYEFIIDLRPFVDRLVSLSDTLIECQFTLSETYSSIQVLLNNKLVDTTIHDGSLGEFSIQLTSFLPGWNEINIRGVSGETTATSDSKFIVMVGKSTGIKPTEGLSSVRVVPNPVREHSKLVFESELHIGLCHIAIYNISGQIVYLDNGLKQTSKYEIEIPNSLGTGGYVLRLSCGKFRENIRFDVLK